MAEITANNGNYNYKEEKKMKAFKFIATVAVAVIGVTIADRKLGWGLAEWIEKKYDKGIDKISRNKNNSGAASAETTDAA